MPSFPSSMNYDTGHRQGTTLLLPVQYWHGEDNQQASASLLSLSGQGCCSLCGWYPCLGGGSLSSPSSWLKDLCVTAPGRLRDNMLMGQESPCELFSKRQAFCILCSGAKDLRPQQQPSPPSLVRSSFTPRFYPWPRLAGRTRGRPCALLHPGGVFFYTTDR